MDTFLYDKYFYITGFFFFSSTPYFENPASIICDISPQDIYIPGQKPVPSQQNNIIATFR